MTDGPFDDILAANGASAALYEFGDLEARAAKGLCVLTCMDSRIDPLQMLGLARGDAKVLRNAGARVTDEVLRDLVVAHYLLGAARVMVVAHTRCAMASGSDASIHEAIVAHGGPDTTSLRFLATGDQEATLREDVERVRSFPLLPGVTVGGFVYELETGRLRQVC
ncbi:MAG: carbonic anhydrase [Actinomycetota bacterium]|jgi:carbonic anhydrase|nr:carbonic anhydrase [Actinomycetota bacterium]